MSNDELDPLSDCYKPDGSLFSNGWYLSWSVGSETACLDGEFTAADLIAIAKHMEKQPT
jgi:hypothetical protein